MVDPLHCYCSGNCHNEESLTAISLTWAHDRSLAWEGKSAKAQLGELSCIREGALETAGRSSFRNVFLSRSAQAGLEQARKRHANTLVPEATESPNMSPTL